MFRRWISVLAALCLLLCDVSSALAATVYTFIDLGTLGSGTTTVSEVGPGGLSSSGLVAGWSSGGTNVGMRGFCWNSGTMTDLGSLGGNNTWAYGINASGQIVGDSYTSDPVERAFLYSGGTMHSLPTLASTGWTCAFGISDTGKIVGIATNSQGVQIPVIWNNGSVTDLGGLGGYSVAKAINSHDQIAGYSVNGSGYYHAVMWNGGSKTDLGSLPGWNNAWVWDMNDNGQIVGEAFNTYGSVGRGYIWSGGVFTPLGTLGGTKSRASAINNKGQVVGMARDSAGYGRPFFYQSGVMTDLNTLINPATGWTLQSADDINDSGMICGNAQNSLGQSHAYLLIPVPEPSPLFLLSMGAFGLLAWGWRRRKANRILVCVIALLFPTAGAAQAVTIGVVPVGSGQPH